MRVETLQNIIEDVGPDREVIVQLPHLLGVLTEAERYEVKSARIEGDRYVVIELGSAVPEEGAAT